MTFPETACLNLMFVPISPIFREAFEPKKKALKQTPLVGTPKIRGFGIIFSAIFFECTCWERYTFMPETLNYLKLG